MKQKVGKLVAGVLYIECSAIDELSPKDARMYKQAISFVPSEVAWSVLKIDRRRNGVSFLDYEPFETVAFPALRQSFRVDLSNGRVKTSVFSQRNPPILHRKELLLSNDDPRRFEFAALTKRIENLGLFKDMHKMGRRIQWQVALKRAGLDRNGSAEVV